jgi:hypothetical protein
MTSFMDMKAQLVGVGVTARDARPRGRGRRVLQAAAAASYRDRNRRIGLLKAQGWSNARIGNEMAISAERVRQILEMLPAKMRAEALAEAFDARKEALNRRLRLYLGARERLDRRIRDVRRQLVVEEERESARIDGLLGVAG